jgi:hypothetical protein
MKLFVILLSIYTVYLVSAPCVDDAFHAASKSSGQTTPNDRDSHSDHADACSPFCICSCCSVPVTIAPGTFISQPFFSFQTTLLQESSNFISSFSVSFWQPPKLG